MKLTRSIFLSGFVAGVVVIAISFGIYEVISMIRYGAVISSTEEEREVEIEIEHGTSPRAVAQMLEEHGVIKSAKSFYFYLRYIVKAADKVKAGFYVLSNRMTPDEIIKILQTGRQKEYKFTIPEGATKQDIARIISESGLKTKQEMLDAMARWDLIEEFGVPKIGAGGQKNGVGGGIEGYLFPDTYRFPKNTTPEEILRTMHNRLNEVIDEKMRARMKDMDWSLHEVLTLASIVEKETGRKDERKLIAGVFFNRMRKGIKLQTDPTTVYGLENFVGKIRKRHLLMNHPYNTYIHSDLPPGPIASPGKAAVEAVLWPTKSKYIFFVARNDGSHQFCENYRCHQDAIAHFQKRSKQREYPTPGLGQEGKEEDFHPPKLPYAM